jgi:hypothetical protein
MEKQDCSVETLVNKEIKSFKKKSLKKIKKEEKKESDNEKLPVNSMVLDLFI